MFQDGSAAACDCSSSKYIHDEAAGGELVQGSNSTSRRVKAGHTCLPGVLFDFSAPSVAPSHWTCVKPNVSSYSRCRAALRREAAFSSAGSARIPNATCGHL
jgi:hypothetical protein